VADGHVAVAKTALAERRAGKKLKVAPSRLLDGAAADTRT